MYLVTQMTTKQVQRRRQEQPWRLFCVSFLLFFVALLPGVVWSGLFQSTTCSLISLLSFFSSHCVLNRTCACLYTHTGTHTPTCIYTHIHTDAHTHTHALTHRHRHKHTHTHMHMHTIMHTDTHRHAQAHTLSHKQTHTITHTHTHTNIRTHIPPHHYFSSCEFLAITVHRGQPPAVCLRRRINVRAWQQLNCDTPCDTQSGETHRNRIHQQSTQQM